MKIIYTNFLICIILILSSLSYALHEDKTDKNINNDYGCIVFQFKKDSNSNIGFLPKPRWYPKIIVNDKIFFKSIYPVENDPKKLIEKFYNDGDSFNIIIPSGLTTIRYSLTTGAHNRNPILQTSGFKNHKDYYDNGDEVEQEISLNIKKGETVYLHIIESGRPDKVGIWGSHNDYTGRVRYEIQMQKVAFEIYKSEISSNDTINLCYKPSSNIKYKGKILTTFKLCDNYDIESVIDIREYKLGVMNIKYRSINYIDCLRFLFKNFREKYEFKINNKGIPADDTEITFPFFFQFPSEPVKLYNTWSVDVKRKTDNDKIITEIISFYIIKLTNNVAVIEGRNRNNDMIFRGYFNILQGFWKELHEFTYNQDHEIEKELVLYQTSSDGK